MDAIVGDFLAIEVKGKTRVTDEDLKGLRALSEELPLRHKIVVSMEPTERWTEDRIRILNVNEFFKWLWEWDGIT